MLNNKGNMFITCILFMFVDSLFIYLYYDQSWFNHKSCAFFRPSLLHWKSVTSICVFQCIQYHALMAF